MAELTEKQVRYYATLFADVFKRQGIMSSNTSLLSSNDGPGVQVDSKISEYKEQKLQQKLLKKNNKLLNEYADLQKEINTKSSTATQNLLKQEKIEEKLQTSSTLLGNSYVSAAKAFKRNKLNEKDLRMFADSNSLSKLSKDFGEKIEDAGDSMSDSIVKTGEQIYTKSGRLIDKMYSMLNTKAVLIASFAQFSSEFRAGLKYGSDLNRSFWDSHYNSLKIGIGPSELQELEAKNKRLVNAMGGADNFESAMAKGSGSLFKFYGDLGETTKSTTQALNALSLGGINPTIDMLVKSSGSLTDFTKSMKDTRTMTGQTFSEQNAAMEEYIKSDSIKSRLVSLGNSTERMSMVKRGIANKTMLSSLGLTAEQADRAAAAFNSVAGMDPKDRLKESYKAQAMMGALGIEGAKEFGEVIRAGGFASANITAEQRKKALIASEQWAKREAKSRSGAADNADNLMIGSASKIMASFSEITKSGMDLALADKQAAKDALNRVTNPENEMGGFKTAFIDTVSSGLKYFDMVSTGLATNGLLTGLLGVNGAILWVLRSGMKSFKPSMGSASKNSKSKKAGVFSRTKDKSKELFGKAREKMTKPNIINSGKTLLNKGANLGKSVASKAGNLLKFGGKLLGKAVPVLAVLNGITDGISGWSAANKTFSVKDATAGMKAASAFGGVISGLSFGLIDSAKIAKSTHDMFGGNDKSPIVNTKLPINNMKAKSYIDIDDKTSNVNKGYKVKPYINPKIKNMKFAGDIKSDKIEKTIKTKELLLQTELLKSQQENIELLKMNNEILASNFEKLHNDNIKHIKSNQDIKAVLESDDNIFNLSSFDDNISVV